MNTTPAIQRHQGPHLGLLAILYTVLFNAGLYPVTAYAGKPYWPGPWESASVIVPYFQTHHTQVLACLFLQFGAIVCLGLFTSVAVSKLRFLGVRSAGPWIALLGGFLVVFDGFAGAFTTWTLIHPAVVQTPSVVIALYYLAYSFGGPGILSADGPADRRHFHPGTPPQASAKMDLHSRNRTCHYRRAELVPSHQSTCTLSYSVDAFSRVYLDHSGCLCIAQNHSTAHGFSNCITSRRADATLPAVFPLC